MRAVNLLPHGEALDAKKLPAAPILAGCVGTVLVTAVLAIMFLSASSKVGNEKATLQRLQVQLAATPPPEAAKPSSVESSLPQERSARISALATALSQRIAWDRILREVSLVVPDDVWLSDLAATSPEAGAPAAGTPPPAGSPASTGTAPSGFTVDGYTYSQDGVARLLSRLQVLPDLAQVTLKSSTRTKLGNRWVFQFAIAAAVRAPGSTA